MKKFIDLLAMIFILIFLPGGWLFILFRVHSAVYAPQSARITDILSVIEKIELSDIIPFIFGIIWIVLRYRKQSKLLIVALLVFILLPAVLLQIKSQLAFVLISTLFVLAATLVGSAWVISKVNGRANVITRLFDSP